MFVDIFIYENHKRQVFCVAVYDSLILYQSYLKKKIVLHYSDNEWLFTKTRPAASTVC